MLATFMILAHHFAVHNVYDYTQMAAGPTRFFIQFFLESGGKIGVVVFFTISAWFFLEREQTLKACVRRIWFLEKEVLFYSVVLAVVFFSMGWLGPRGFVESFLPLTWSQWWYPTAYALFLLFLPFLDRGLRSLGRKSHLVLCSIMLLLYGLVSLIPDTQMVGGVYSFVYLYVLISAYRWYLEDSHPLKPWPLIGAGSLLLAVFVLAAMMAYPLFGLQIGIPRGDFVTREVRLPVLLVGFGLFLLFDSISFKSRAINVMASGSFAVYLITDFSSVEQHLWTGPFDLGILCSEPLGLLWALGVLVLIYLGCTVIDLLRQGLFCVSVDRFWGRLFDWLWTKALCLGKHMATLLDDLPN